MATLIPRALCIPPVPFKRTVPQVDTFPHLADASRVLLASAGRLAWYRYDTDELRVLHEGTVSGDV